MLFSVVSIGCFFICRFAVVDYLMKRFYTARYLALKIGTNSKVFDLIGLCGCLYINIRIIFYTASLE